jgi:hypothetical protein
MDIFKSELAYSSSQEPVTLTEAKAHILVDFTTDDTYIQALITQCRAAIESYCNICITPKNITWTFDSVPEPGSYPPWISRWDLAFYGFTNCTKWLRMPWGPVETGTISVTNVTDAGVITTLTANTDYFIRGQLFKEIKINFFTGNVVVNYRGKWPYDSTSSEQIPADLKLAILNEIAFRYTNRGDAVNRYAQQSVGISEGAQSAAAKFLQIWL